MHVIFMQSTSFDGEFYLIDDRFCIVYLDILQHANEFYAKYVVYVEFYVIYALFL